ncbi:hypothetical protein [Teredinibacter sp. KSP-S5-2]|uniref:hypothetical protein n=1 Tax=Teredinibacter sp. KSP-S5-2 TaxID=3034506 RepID=UPI002934338B|nr:hypothetical protein [Teredinibacter sp. KSP-S5-2]WNO09529.1 hypothetical protein P5V12_21560 [Teredinibacter sp. KSP-S5-2]
MNIVSKMVFCTLIFASSQTFGELVSISNCGPRCEISLSEIGSYLETEVPSGEWMVSIWSTNKAVQSCLAKKVKNPGSWSEYGEDWQGFRTDLEGMVHAACIEPMFKQTGIRVLEILLEKERFLDPKDKREYTLNPVLIPKGSYLNQVWIRGRVEKPGGKRK